MKLSVINMFEIQVWFACDPLKPVPDRAVKECETLKTVTVPYSVNPNW